MFIYDYLAMITVTADATGQTDASSVIQTQINNAAAAGNCVSIYLPAGYYRLDNSISAQNCHFNLKGDHGATRLIVNNSTAGVLFSTTTADPLDGNEWTCEIDGITLVSQKAADFGINLSYRAAAGGRESPTARIRNVHFVMGAAGFQNCIRAQYAGTIEMDRIRSVMIGANSIHLWLDGSSAVTWYDINLSNSNFQGGNYGIYMTPGSHIEGVTIGATTMVGQMTCIKADSTGTAISSNPNFAIQAGCEFNAKVSALSLTGWGSVFLTGSDFYKGVGTGDVPENVVELFNGNRIIVSGNKFECVVASQAHSMVYLQNISGGVVSGNLLMSQAPGGGIGLVQCSQIQVAGNLMTTNQGTTDQAVYMQTCTTTNIADNLVQGWTTALGGGTNTNCQFGNQPNSNWPNWPGTNTQF